MQAFIDDSETFRRGGLVILAGYLADDAQWDSFAVEWSMVLRKHNMNWLHTSDFLAGDGDYRGMKLIPAGRIEIIRELMLVVRKHVQCGVAVGIDPVAFKEVMGKLPKAARLGKAVDFCFMRILRLCVEHMKRFDIDRPIMLTFDDSHENSATFYHSFRRLRRKHIDLLENTVGIGFCDDRRITPLQAADMLACISGREHSKGDAAWADGSPFRDLLLDTDPAYGLLYHNELWDRDQLFNHPNMVAALNLAHQI